MLFTSSAFLVFLPVVFCLYWFVFNKGVRHQNALVLVSSYVFYGWWNWKFVGLLLLSTLLDYAFGNWVDRNNGAKRKLFLVLSVVSNLLVLCVFKYYNFFIRETQHLFEHAGLSIHPSLLKVLAPVGISFYTFHGMSYVMDIYRRRFTPVTHFIDYAVFVAFFPLLVAGPIERAAHLLPQIQQPRKFSYEQAVQGLRLMLWGFFKKMVIADTLAPVVDDIFVNYTHYPGSTLVLGAIYFSFQIYGDFSGYTDIALGVAKLFGFELFTNFKFPYFSRDVAEFWRRWHISLSSWFRDYLYIPLGGSRCGRTKAIRNTFLIFLLSGFWHGANWTYIVWGGIHALGFMPLLVLGMNRKHSREIVAYDRRFPRAGELASILATFSFVTLAWVFFRAESIGKAVHYLWNMRKGLLQPPSNLSYLFLYVLPFILLDWCFRKNEREVINVRPKLARYAIYVAAIFIIIAHSENNVSFIYFQF